MSCTSDSRGLNDILARFLNLGYAGVIKLLTILRIAIQINRLVYSSWYDCEGNVHNDFEGNDHKTTRRKAQRIA